jgi:Spy/CpxP family protein refolding chaperone
MKFPTLLLSVVLLACLSLPTHSQEKPVKPEEEGAARKIVNRLPNNYGKLGLSTTQREKIYAVQSTYRAKINALQQELEDLRSQESLEIQAVLTAEQQVELQRLLEESRLRRTQKTAEK